MRKRVLLRRRRPMRPQHLPPHRRNPLRQQRNPEQAGRPLPHRLPMLLRQKRGLVQRRQRHLPQPQPRRLRQPLLTQMEFRPHIPRPGTIAIFMRRKA